MCSSRSASPNGQSPVRGMHLTASKPRAYHTAYFLLYPILRNCTFTAASLPSARTLSPTRSSAAAVAVSSAADVPVAVVVRERISHVSVCRGGYKEAKHT